MTEGERSQNKGGVLSLKAYKRRISVFFYSGAWKIRWKKHVLRSIGQQQSQPQTPQQPVVSSKFAFDAVSERMLWLAQVELMCTWRSEYIW